MVNIHRVFRIIITVIIIMAVIWLVYKKTESMKTLKPGENRNNEISGFDRVMFEMTGLMEKINPSSPFTNQMKKTKANTFKSLIN